ncbi:MAG: hypothetical protein O2951_18075, partial [Bacteroidetes bacterium]|nr:hypothetical protein [Bacteroidota bacterium]
QPNTASPYWGLSFYAMLTTDPQRTVPLLNIGGLTVRLDRQFIHLDLDKVPVPKLGFSYCITRLIKHDWINNFI